MRFGLWVLCWACVCMGTLGAAQSNTITLTSKSKTLVLDGALLDFDGRYFAIESAYGPVVLDGLDFDCSGDACPDKTNKTEILTLVAPQSLNTVLMPALIENFAARRARSASHMQTDGDMVTTLTSTANPDRKLIIRLKTADTDSGIAMLIDQSARAAIGFRPLNTAEKTALISQNQTSLGTAQTKALALDAIIPVIAPPSAKTAIDLTAFTDGFGANSTDPLIVSRQTGGYLAALGHATKPATDLTALVGQLYGDPDAIGAVSFSNLSGLQVLDIASDCGMVPKMTRKSIKNGDYPFNVPIYLHLAPYILGPQSNEFLDYITSPAAQMVFQRAGFVDQTVEEIPLSAQGDRLGHAIATVDAQSLPHLQSLMREVRNASRLTLTFRFDGATGAFDDLSLARLRQLTDLIKAGRFKNRRLSFIGFSDKSTDFTANLDDSQNLAAAVLQAALEHLDGHDMPLNSMVSMGYGSVVPVTCASSDFTQTLNRRVEVWQN